MTHRQFEAWTWWMGWRKDAALRPASSQDVTIAAAMAKAAFQARFGVDPKIGKRAQSDGG